ESATRGFAGGDFDEAFYGLATSLDTVPADRSGTARAGMFSPDHQRTELDISSASRSEFRSYHGGRQRPAQRSFQRVEPAGAASRSWRSDQRSRNDGRAVVLV